MADDREPGEADSPSDDDVADGDDQPSPPDGDAGSDGSPDDESDEPADDAPDKPADDAPDEPADDAPDEPADDAPEEQSDSVGDGDAEDTGDEADDDDEADDTPDDDAADSAGDDAADEDTDEDTAGADGETPDDDDAADDHGAGDAAAPVDAADPDAEESGGDVTDNDWVEDASIDDDTVEDPLADLPDPGGPRDEDPPGAQESDLEAVEAEPTVAGAEETDAAAATPPVDAETVTPAVEDDDDDFWGSGPASDEEMPLADHIEEMMRRLSVVFAVGGVATLAVLGLGQAIEWIPSAVEIIHFLWNHNVPGAPELQDRRPRIYGPLELLLTKLKVAGLAGILVGLPVFVYETYLFMRPGLYPHERRYYLAAVPTSLVLGIIGMAFAHFVVLPAIFSYFTAYTQGTALVAYGLRETFNLILLLMGYMAIVFQIPLFIMLAIMMNLVTRIWLEEKRLIFWGTFLGLAFLVSPDPTGMAPIIIAATMVTLYEGTLALLRWTGN